MSVRSMNVDSCPWEELVRADLEPLPLGGRLVRTDPRGPTPAPIAIVGLYPALTKMAPWHSNDGIPGASTPKLLFLESFFRPITNW